MSAEENVFELVNQLEEEINNVCENNRDLNPVSNNEWQNYYHYQWCPVVRFQNQFYPPNNNSEEGQNSTTASNELFKPIIRPMLPFPADGPITRWPQTPSMTSMPPLPPFSSMSSIPSMTSMPPLPPFSSMPSMPSMNYLQHLNAVSNELKAGDHSVEQRFFCQLCDAFYETNDKLKFQAHIETHSGPAQPFNCQICDKQFKFRSQWRNHIMAHMKLKVRNVFNQSSITKSNNRLNCDECEYNCKERSKLERHKRMHSGLKPFKCPSCDYESYDKTKIRRHYVTHTREKPFCCEKCKSRFTQSGSLKSHLAKVHRKENVELNCAYCQSFSTTNLGELRIHIKQTHGNVPFTYAIAN